MIVHANAATCMPGHALELFVPALMLLRACAVHARFAHARRWHGMGDKCISAAPNQLLTGILASIMQSLCLFRRNPADNAACAPRYTAAQPCRPAPRMPAHSQNLAWTQNFYLSQKCCVPNVAAFFDFPPFPHSSVLLRFTGSTRGLTQ